MLLDRIKKLADNTHKEAVAVRRHIHQYPELSFEEEKTAQFIAKKLEEFGIACQKNVAGHGVVGHIKGQQPNSKVIALRADIDALPILEANDVSYKSKNEGVMHACGHDVHTASLLGTAKILNELKSDFKGSIKLIFQPAEERLPGGASLMIKDGVLENPKPAAILGQHVHPPLSVGKIGLRPGIYMASADELYFTITGKGGHGALPHETVDTILVTAHIITALQQIVSRNNNPTLPSVLTIGKINSVGGATNIIPDKVKLMGTFRTFDEKWRFEAHRLIKKMTTELAASMGAQAEVDILVGYPFLHNDEKFTRQNIDAAMEYMGANNVVELPIRMTAEDFAYYSHHLPACFYRLGTGNASKGITSPVHTNTFDIDEESLRVGSGLMAWLAVRALGNME